jgi:methyl-accepting chemotaxis protein
MDQVTQRNAAAGEQLASTAEEVASQAEGLQQLIAFFKVSGAEKLRARTARDASGHAGSIGASPHASALQTLMVDRSSSHGATDPTTVDSEFQRF